MVPRPSSFLHKFFWLMLLCGVFAVDALAQVGTIQFVAGDVRIRNAVGAERLAQKGGTLAEGDTIITGSGASAQLKMIDNGIIAVRTDSELKLDQYAYKGKEDGSERAFLSLVKGGFRTITGLIGRTNRQNYRVTTPTATIGIRGTDYESYFVAQDIPRGQPVARPSPASPTRLAQAAVAVEFTVDVPDTVQLAQAAPGLAGPSPAFSRGDNLVRVNAGGVGLNSTISNRTLNIAPGQIGLADARGVLTLNPPGTDQIFQAAPPPGKPAPGKPAADKPAADKPAADKPAIAEAPAEKPAAAPPPAEKVAATPAPSVAAEPSPVSEVRSVAVVDAAPPPLAPTTTTLATVATVLAPTTLATTTPTAPTTTNTITQPVILESSTGLDLNLTTQQVTTSTGSTAPISQGTFALQAQSAADQALASKNALNSLVTSAGMLAGSSVSLAISNASPTVTSAQSAVSTAQALTINSATASSNAVTSAASAATALSQNNAALAAFTANGTFADSTAVTAKNNLTAANNALQTANTTAQNSLATVNTNAAALTAAQQAANAALTAANPALSSANSLLTTLTSAGLQNSTASAQLSIAQNAASLAQSEATSALNAQSIGNFTGAQQHGLNAAMHAAAAAGALSAATQIISGVISASSASTLASTAITEAGNAQSAASAGGSAASAITSNLAVVNANAPIVTANAPRTAFNNPAVASTNFSHVASSQKAAAGGTVRSFMGASSPKPNTNYVLDGNKSLVEIRSTSFGGPGPTDNINDADVIFSGGVAKDLFKAPDNTFYMGRIQGGQIDVTANATTTPNPVMPLPFTRQLGPTSAHWLIGLMPGSSSFSTTLGPINNVQTLVGAASYNLTAATHPTDSFGNVGTLNSASLTANFSSQTVSTALNLSFSSSDAINVSSRNLNLTASAANVPIVREGGPLNALFFETGSPSVTCTGAGCAPSGYVGEIGGAFGGTATGTVGTGVGLSYDFVPAPRAMTNNGVDSDFIHGVAVLNTTTAPVTGVINNFPDNTRVRHEVLYQTSSVGLTDTFAVRARDTINLETPTPATLSGPRVNTNYLFDASGNLVRIFDTPYVIFDHGTDLATTTQFAAPTPLAHAQVSFGGGGSVPADVFNFTPSGGTLPIIRMGRWQGGFVNVMDLQPPAGFILPGFIDSLVSPLGGGSRSVHWLVRQGVPIIPTTGAFHYVRIQDTAGNNSFATAPTDSYGNVGTLERARLTADFTRMRVSAGLAVTMPSGTGGSLGIQNLSGTFGDAPLQGGGFNVSSNPANNPPNTDRFNVRCFGAGCAPNQTYGGRVRGAFAGLNAEGAFYRYTFNTNYDPATNPAPAGRVNDDYIEGLVAFRQGPAIVTPPLTHPAGPSEVLTVYRFSDATSSQPRAASFAIENPATLTLDGSGNFVSVLGPALSVAEHNDTLTLTGGLINNNGLGSTTPISAGNGITLGWRSNSPPLTVSGRDFNGTFTNRAVMGDGLSWVRGPGVFPWYLPGAIATISNSDGTVVTGTASFNLTGSIVRDQNGLGATGPVTAGLLANFNQAAVGFDMTIPTAAGTWAAFNNGTTPGGAIVANIRMEQDGGFHAFTGTQTTTPTGINTHRQMTVTLNTSPGFGNVQGQFMGPGVKGAGMTYTFSTSSNRVLGALAFDNPTPFSAETPYHLVGAASGMNPLGQFDEEENTPIRGGFVSRSRTQFVNGLPVRVDLEFPVAAIPTGCTTCTTFVNDIPAVFAVTGATASGTGFTSISIGNAQIFDSGIDPATGIRWGRYGGPGSAAGAFIGVTDRISGAVLPSIDVGPATQGVHFIATGVQSGPTVLPISGTFNYTRVGNTMPTDNFGNVGGVLNSATLTANFTAKTVSSAVNLTVAGATWNASASNMPIQRGTFFEAAKNLDGTGNLTVTRAIGGGTPSAASTAGRLLGAFTGPTGVGAAVLYSLNQGGNHSPSTNPTATTVSGVVGFKR